MKAMTTTLRSSLVLVGSEMDPDEVTRRTGLQPSRTWRRGEPIQQTLLQREHSGWVLEIPEEVSLDLGEQVKRLLDRFWPQAAAIAGARRECGIEIEIACEVYVRGQTPSIHFDQLTLARIVELGAEIDVDIHFLPAEDE
jgi:uncharacterized protein DUF4279